MKNAKAHCPGCSRHCPMNAVRCKYGQKYFEKHGEEVHHACKAKKDHPKWMKHVAENSLVFTFLTTGKRVKKALCHQKISETALLNVLTAEEKETLSNLLHKLNAVISEK